MIQQQRIRVCNDKAFRKRSFIVYWMQQSQRVEYNHALEYAIAQSNHYQKPLLVYFGVTDTFPDANLRHYQFMLQGLKNVEKDLQHRNISFFIEKVSPEQGILALSKDACMIVVDKGYLRLQRQWREHVARVCDCAMVEVESDVVVPVEVASVKAEYSAATFRPKLQKNLGEYLKAVEPIFYTQGFVEHKERGQCCNDIKLDRVDSSVQPVQGFVGGTDEAKKRLTQFITSKLDQYPVLRNDPNADMVSHLSPYLHFGQISSLYIALEIQQSGSVGVDAFLDELLVRRELAVNFVYYTKEYDAFSCLPVWAKKSLDEHKNDIRQYVYSVDEFERSLTHDPYWNAAQKQMRWEGKIHGYMRMYWGKKILEWSKTAQQAFETALYLNNKYELDGRDANGYAGVAWCFGLHDRPWGKRAVFGNVRYMNENGLKRKFDSDAYAKRYRE